MNTTKPAPRFPGINRAARKLGVTRQHLYFVLTGQRQSARLLAKVQEQFPTLIEQN
jgi:hypothetical protein